MNFLSDNQSTVFSEIIQYLSIESDPCDIECDNCINPEQCIECYEECYSRTI